MYVCLCGCRFQFGDEQGGLVHPLEGDEKVADSEMQMYQYFIEVVPTDVHGLLGTTHTYQYSVKEQVSITPWASIPHTPTSTRSKNRSVSLPPPPPGPRYHTHLPALGQGAGQYLSLPPPGPRYHTHLPVLGQRTGQYPSLPPPGASIPHTPTSTRSRSRSVPLPPPPPGASIPHTPTSTRSRSRSVPLPPPPRASIPHPPTSTRSKNRSALGSAAEEWGGGRVRAVSVGVCLCLWLRNGEEEESGR